MTVHEKSDKQHWTGHRDYSIVIFVFITCVAVALVAIGWPRVRSNTSSNTSALDVPALSKYNASSHVYSLLFVADRDKASLDAKRGVWESLLARATLYREEDPQSDEDDGGGGDNSSNSSSSTSQRYQLIWTNEIYTLSSSLSERGRGMELSELKWFGERLYTVDDRTGILYQVMLPRHITDVLHSQGDPPVHEPHKDPWLLPRMILMDGDGESLNKGFKAEWMTVKDRSLIVGGMGKEWHHATTGAVIGDWPLWIKTIPYDAAAHADIVRNVNFGPQYSRLRHAVLGADSVEKGGYLLHEAAEWSDHHRRWFFLPRRVSSMRYHEEGDLHRGANIIVSADESFSDIKVVHIKQDSPKTRGFSTFKFIPHRPNEIVAVKSEETTDGVFNSYITVVTIDGDVLMPETWFIAEKIEGIEFI